MKRRSERSCKKNDGTQYRRGLSMHAGKPAEAGVQSAKIEVTVVFYTRDSEYTIKLTSDRRLNRSAAGLKACFALLTPLAAYAHSRS